MRANTYLICSRFTRHRRTMSCSSPLVAGTIPKGSVLGHSESRAVNHRQISLCSSVLAEMLKVRFWILHIILAIQDTNLKSL